MNKLYNGRNLHQSDPGVCKWYLAYTLSNSLTPNLGGLTQQAVPSRQLLACRMGFNSGIYEVL